MGLANDCESHAVPRSPKGLRTNEKHAIFSFMITEKKSSQNIDKSIQSRIFGHRRGWVFSSSDFSDLGLRPAIDSALLRLKARGTIRGIMRGLYEYPRFGSLLDQALSPDIDQVARALARKFGWRIQPSGVIAENLIGLSTQIPAQVVYLSDGPNRAYRIGKTSLKFKRTTLKDIGFKHRQSGLIVHALKSIGSTRANPEIVMKIRRWLPRELRAKILQDTKASTGWVRAAIQEITREDEADGQGRSASA